MKNDEGYADRVLREALTASIGGLDAEGVERALGHAIAAIGKQMAALEATDYGDMPRNPEVRSLPSAALPLLVTFGGAVCAWSVRPEQDSQHFLRPRG